MSEVKREGVSCTHQPSKLIIWLSTDRALVGYEGTHRIRPGPGGTMITPLLSIIPLDTEKALTMTTVRAMFPSLTADPRQRRLEHVIC